MSLPNTWQAVALLAMMAVGHTGCSGCDEATAPPLPVAQEGRLPPAPAVSVSPIPPAQTAPSCVSILTPDVEEGPAPLTVNLSAEGLCTDAEGEFTIDFGDGSPSVKAAVAQHVYVKPGEYIARATLTDAANGASDTDEMAIVVSAP